MAKVHNGGKGCLKYHYNDDYAKDIEVILAWLHNGKPTKTWEGYRKIYRS